MRGGTKRKQIRGATFLFVLVLILGAVTPIAPVVVWLLPAPLLYLWVYGEPSWVVILCVVTLAGTLFGGSLAYLSIPVLLAACIAGIVGEAWKRGQFPITPLAIGTFLLTGISILVMGIAFIWYGFSFPNEIGKQVQQMVLHNMLTVQPGNISDLSAMAHEYQLIMNDNFPAILIIVCFLIIFFNIYLARWGLLKYRPEHCKQGSFADWKLPSSVAWINIVTVLVSFINWSANNHIAQVMVENVLMISSFFLALQGLSLIWRVISRYHRVKWSMLAIVALGMNHLIWLLYIALGFFDCIFRNRSTAFKK